MTDASQQFPGALSLIHSFEFDSQSVRYGVIGSGKPMVFVHGTPFSSQVWRRIAPIAARFRQVFYFDLLGYGMSEQRAGQYANITIFDVGSPA